MLSPTTTSLQPATFLPRRVHTPTPRIYFESRVVRDFRVSKFCNRGGVVIVRKGHDLAVARVRIGPAVGLLRPPFVEREFGAIGLETNPHFRLRYRLDTRGLAVEQGPSTMIVYGGKQHDDLGRKIVRVVLWGLHNKTIVEQDG